MQRAILSSIAGLSALALSFCAIDSARAGSPPTMSGDVVVACGTANHTYAAGTSDYVTVDTQGRWCGLSTSNGGQTATVVSSGSAANGIIPTGSSAAESCHNYKAAPGNVYALGGVIGSAGWVFILNLAADPVNGTVAPVAWGYYPAQGSWSYTPPVGGPAVLSAGIEACYSSTGPFTLTKLTSTALSNSVFSGEAQ